MEGAFSPLFIPLSGELDLILKVCSRERERGGGRL